jgi:hypothetical protein
VVDEAAGKQVASKKKVGPQPVEEMRKDLMTVTCNVVAIVNNGGNETMDEDPFKPPKKGMEWLARIYRLCLRPCTNGGKGCKSDAVNIKYMVVTDHRLHFKRMVAGQT